MHSVNSIIKRLSAPFQFRIGMDHFFAAASMAMYTTFKAAGAFGNTLRFI
jgi:hypothetical protein